MVLSTFNEARTRMTTYVINKVSKPRTATFTVPVPGKAKTARISRQRLVVDNKADTATVKRLKTLKPGREGKKHFSFTAGYPGLSITVLTGSFK